MEPGIFYLRFENKDTEGITDPNTKTPNCCQDEGKAQKRSKYKFYSETDSVNNV